MNFNNWIRQPTNIHAIAVITAGIGAALSHVATANPTVNIAVAVAAYLLVHLGINDNSALEIEVTAVTTDLLTKAPVETTLADAAKLANLGDAAFKTPPAP